MNIQAPRPPMGPLIEALKALLGDRLSVSAAVREQHGHDESYHATLPPDAVAFAQSTAEVAAIMRLAAQHGAPVVPFGTGTSLEGHVAAIEGGISIDLDYPVHRYFLWSKQLEFMLGPGNQHLATLGASLAAEPVAS